MKLALVSIKRIHMVHGIVPISQNRAADDNQENEQHPNYFGSREAMPEAMPVPCTHANGSLP